MTQNSGIGHILWTALPASYQMFAASAHYSSCLTDIGQCARLHPVGKKCGSRAIPPKSQSVTWAASGGLIRSSSGMNAAGMLTALLGPQPQQIKTSQRQTDA